ncbi:MAG: NfeD family protein [Dehalococcoidales bacterium]|nr:NfeD family protein [Dehalococcoidales bacterium]
MSGRLILAILSTLLEETALAVVVLVGLPELGIHLPLAVLIALMIGWAVVAVIVYRAGSHALRVKPMAGPEAIIGMKGKVVRPLDPDGLIKIGGELWRAKSAGSSIDIGEKVTVVERNGTMLIVHPGD